MENVEAYSIAMISLLVFVLIALFQSAVVGALKAKAGVTPGSDVAPKYEDALYRADRSHQNATEIMAAAAVALLISILAGVSAWWVNLLMGLFLLTRIVYIAIYAQNVGKPTQGARTFAFVAGWATLVVLCLMAIVALI